MEFDGASTFIGSSYVYASARSFARFGELYLNDGVTRDGRRILPAGWVAWSRSSTLGQPYGAGFWTNDGPSELAAKRVAAGFPKDGFFASGNMGQRIYIVPSQRLVVARFGYSAPPTFGIADDIDLIAAAIRGGQNARVPDVGSGVMRCFGEQELGTWCKRTRPTQGAVTGANIEAKLFVKASAH